MPLSMWQDESNVYIEADVPGLAEGDIDVTVHEEMVTISGERKCERKVEGCDGANIEWPRSVFSAIVPKWASALMQPLVVTHGA